MNPKRYGLGIERSGGIGQPAIVEMEHGEYVQARFYDAAVAHNEMLVARLKMQAEQMEAIGAGGVSRQRITQPAACAELTTAERMEKEYHDERTREMFGLLQP